MRYLYRAMARMQFRSNDPSTWLLILQGKRSAPRRNVRVVLSRILNRMLPPFASNDPAFVNGFDARGHVIKGADVNFDLTLIATEDARTTNRTKASSPKGHYQTGVFELPGLPIRVSKKCRARHLAAIGAMTEAAF